MRLKQDRCRDKIVYPDWLTAEGEALRLMEDLRDGRLKRVKGGTVWAYRCGSHFHIGHQPKPKTWTMGPKSFEAGQVLRFRCFDRRDRLGGGFPGVLAS